MMTTKKACVLTFGPEIDFDITVLIRSQHNTNHLLPSPQGHWFHNSRWGYIDSQVSVFTCQYHTGDLAELSSCEELNETIENALLLQHRQRNNVYGP